MAALVYGIVRAGHPVPTADGALRLVASGELAAIVRDLPEDAELRDEDVVAYFDGLVATLAGGPVLPIRFGTVAPDDAEIRSELLDVDPGELAGRLDALDGLIEVWLHIDADVDGQTRRLAKASPELLRAWSLRAGHGTLEDRAQLGQEIGDKLAELREELSEHVVGRLGGLAEAHTRVQTLEVTELRHAYLVRSERLAAFDRAVEKLRDELGAGYAIEYVGPLPPFELNDVAASAPEPSRSRWGW